MFPEFEFDWLIDTIKRNLPKELDFVQEGQNCEHVSRLFTDTPFLKVCFFLYHTEALLVRYRTTVLYRNLQNISKFLSYLSFVIFSKSLFYLTFLSHVTVIPNKLFIVTRYL